MLCLVDEQKRHPQGCRFPCCNGQTIALGADAILDLSQGFFAQTSHMRHAAGARLRHAPQHQLAWFGFGSESSSSMLAWMIR